MWDVFISHAWEDKEALARPLAETLREKGLCVWYDEFALRIGDSLRRSIDHGLANSRYGIVILSPHFFAKKWPQKELDGLVAREDSGEKVILPVWHNVTVNQVRKYSPTLADRIAVLSDRGLDHVVAELLRVIKPVTEPVRPPRHVPPRVTMLETVRRAVKREGKEKPPVMRELEALSLVARGEDERRAFKKELDLKSSTGKAGFVKDVIALANSAPEGGYLLIGVDDDKSIVGINELEEERIQQIAQTYIDPAVKLRCFLVPMATFGGSLSVGVIQIRSCIA